MTKDNQSVLSKTKMPTIGEMSMITRMKWFGHVQRILRERLLKKLTNGTLLSVIQTPQKLSEDSQRYG